MALISINHIAMKGVAAAVPKRIVSNFDLSGYEPDELNKLIKTIGIQHRRESETYQCASDLCLAAVNELLQKLNWDKDEIGALLFVTQTPDYLIPGTSFHLKERLGLKKDCVVFDLNQGCAGYVYGLSNLSAFMKATNIKKGLLLVGDTITKLIAAEDKSLKPLFSDCGTATALELDETASDLHFNLSSEGDSYESIMIKKGGAREIVTDPNGLIHLNMKGLEVFNFSLTKVIPNIEDLLSKHHVSSSTIDWAIFHQANSLILESLGKKMGIEKEKIPSSLKEYGNTSGASIPLTMVVQFQGTQNLWHKNVLLCGFGVGLSIGSVFVKTNELICCELIQVA